MPEYTIALDLCEDSVVRYAKICVGGKRWGFRSQVWMGGGGGGTFLVSFVFYVFVGAGAELLVGVNLRHLVFY